MHLYCQVSFRTTDSNLSRAQGKMEGDRGQPAIPTESHKHSTENKAKEGILFYTYGIYQSKP